MQLVDHLPHVLRAIGPRGLAWWQWAALPVLFAAAWIAGYFVGRVIRALLAMAARRTKTTWDDQIVAGMGGPLTLLCTAGAVRVMAMTLSLPAPFEASLFGGLRTVVYVAFFWFLLRLVTVAGTIINGSTWALTRPASRSLLPLAARILQVTVLAMAVIAVLADLGFAVTSLITGLGIGGLALALAGQKTVENLFGAFSIGVDQPFRVGDFVNVEGLMGNVEIIGLRSTRIRTLDRTVVTIPNGKLADMKIESFAPRDRIRFATVLGLSRSTTAAQMRQVLAGLEAAIGAQKTLFENSVTVRFKDINPSSLDVEVQAWFATTDYAAFQRTREDLLLTFMETVEKSGTSFALPTRAVQVQSRDGKGI